MGRRSPRARRADPRRPRLPDQPVSVPIANQRTDRWGGSLENRARLLLDIVREVRQVVGAGFSVSVKINSADFQRGGFSADDAKQVVAMLNPLGVDLIELSGGSYEAPAMHGQTRDGRTLAREAYFLEFAQDIASVAQMPIMVTGGIRRYPAVEQVLNSGIAVACMATALAIAPDLPATWRADTSAAPGCAPYLGKTRCWPRSAIWRW
ncbi:NADH oxidase [Chromobacterium violaceum]|uniref:NADH oxidase n=1 Tax=Chromobacterium violaceum TaxID=536 RepID=A0A447TH33_CHRVL|nr:NADH oxidase [Chromobacterium violaceum]